MSVGGCPAGAPARRCGIIGHHVDRHCPHRAAAVPGHRHQHAGDGPALLDAAVVPVLSVVQATDAQWERARRREAVIADLVNGDDLSDQVTRASTRLGVSRRTVFRWLAAYRDTPQTSSLLARPGGTPTGTRRIDARLEELIAEVFRDVYLTKVRAKKEEVVRQVGLRCSSERLTPPSRKAIPARVRALDTREVAKARLQASEAWAHSAAGAPSTT